MILSNGEERVWVVLSSQKAHSEGGSACGVSWPQPCVREIGDTLRMRRGLVLFLM
jgi:hypothetical protein